MSTNYTTHLIRLINLSLLFLLLFFLPSGMYAEPDHKKYYDASLQSTLDSCLFYRNTDIVSYEKNIESLLIEAVAKNNKYYESAGLIEHAFLNIIETDYQSAINKLKLAIFMAEKIEELNLKIDGLTFKGIAEKELFQYFDAIETFREISKLAAIIDRKSEITGAAHMIAEIYKSGGDLEEAYSYFLDGRPVISVDGKILERQGWWYLNFSDYYFQKGDYAKAIAFCDSSLIVWDHLDMVRGKGYSNNQLGEIYRLTDSPNCISYYKEGLKFNTKMGNKSEMLKSKIGLGNYYAAKSNSEDKAAHWFSEAILFSETNSLNQFIIPALDFFMDRPHLISEYSLQLNGLMETKINAQEIVFRKNSQQGIQLSEAKVALAASMNEELIAKEQASSFKKIISLLILIGTITLGLVLLLIRTISKLNKSQLQIKSLNHELSDNLANLQEKKIQLEYVNETRLKIIERLKKFSAVLSHDLKEPVRTINSFGDLVKRNRNQNLSDKEISYINYMTDGAKRMHNMINTLYKYSNNTLVLLQAFTEVNLDELVDNVKVDFSQKLRENRVTIISDTLGQIEGQKVLLYQLFQNIISNAIKYSKEHIDPVINIQTSNLENDEVQISFQDNGIGIPIEDQKDIFDLFKRANNVEQNHGHGIGLATCKEIVEIHSGKIWLESTIDIGTTIHIVLPTHIQNTSFDNKISDKEKAALNN